MKLEDEYNPYFFEFRSISERIDENIKLLEAGYIESGDIVYCSEVQDDVVLLEVPSSDAFREYHKDKIRYGTAPFSYQIKYRTFNGQIKECSIASISKISKGYFTAQYEIQKGSRDFDIQVENFEYSARSLGFRVEKQQKKDGYMLRFYGDTQEEVDDYVRVIKKLVG